MKKNDLYLFSNGDGGVVNTPKTLYLSCTRDSEQRSYADYYGQTTGNDEPRDDPRMRFTFYAIVSQDVFDNEHVRMIMIYDTCTVDSPVSPYVTNTTNKRILCISESD